MTSENALGKIILEKKKHVVKDFTEILFGLFSGHWHSEKGNVSRNGYRIITKKLWKEWKSYKSLESSFYAEAERGQTGR